MTNLYCKCPFCTRTFDAVAETSTKLQIDGVIRYACSTCTRLYGLSNAPVATQPPDGKPNGGTVHRAAP